MADQPILKRIRRKLYRDYKSLYHKIFTIYEEEKNVIFILGCQRSGTTMLSRIFEKDFNIKNYKEDALLSNNEESKWRLPSFPEVSKELHKNKVKTIILKPLVESQNVDLLLDYFKNSKVIWVYRHYKDVAASDLKKFGERNGINNIRPIALNEPNNWRSEKVSEETKKLIKSHFSEDMNNNDAAALFWYCRNILFFEEGLDENPMAMLCNYEDLVTKPKETFEKVYQFAASSKAHPKLTSDIRSTSLKKGNTLKLSDDVLKKCDKLYDRLNTYKSN